MKLLCKMISIALLASASMVASAVQITFTAGQHTTVAGATVVDFENGSRPGTYSGAGSVIDYSEFGKTAAPAGDVTYYYSVAYPNPTGTGTFQAAGGLGYDYFGLYWGSIDSYNTLSFYSNGLLIEMITGRDVIAAGTPLGDQKAAGSNRYVNFVFDTTFDRIDFHTEGYGFETDNHAFARTTRVPEPAMLGLFAIGLLAAGCVRRRRESGLLAPRNSRH